MGKLTFYRQHRVDGGVRTGIEVGDSTILGLFEEGDSEPDPVLLWFVDLRCDGPDLPQGIEEARTWLLDHSGSIRAGFARCAAENPVGIDPDIYPLIWSGFPTSPEGVRMAIAYSAARRAEGRRLAEVLVDIGSHWEEIIRSLEPLESVTS